MRRIVNAAVIRDGEILLIREKGRNVLTLPGGEVEPGETEEQCLEREISEELACVKPKKVFTYFRSVEAESPGRGDVISVAVYLATLHGHIGAGPDTEAVIWTYQPLEYPLSDATWKIIQLLKREHYLPP